jgi:hypothetical protein
VQVHYASNEATLKVTVPANVAEIGQSMAEQMPTQTVT